MREDGVDNDERSVEKRKPVGGRRERQPSRPPGGGTECERQQRFLPRGDDVEATPSKTRVPQLGEHEIVERESDNEHGEREARNPRGHVIATIVRPRFTMRTGTGKSARSWLDPSSRFSFAHGLRARS